MIFQIYICSMQVFSHLNFSNFQYGKMEFSTSNENFFISNLWNMLRKISDWQWVKRKKVIIIEEEDKEFSLFHYEINEKNTNYFGSWWKLILPYCTITSFYSRKYKIKLFQLLTFGAWAFLFIFRFSWSFSFLGIMFFH